MKSKACKLERRRKKLNKQIQRTREATEEQQTSIRSAINTLGIPPRLRACVQHVVQTNPLPKVGVDLAERPSKGMQAVRKELLHVLERSSFFSPYLGEAFPSAHYLRYVFPVAERVRRLSKHSEFASCLGAMKERVDLILSNETLSQAMNTLYRDLHWILMENSRINRQLYSLSVDELYSTTNLWYVRFKLYETPAEQGIANLDGKARPVLRSGEPRSTGAIEWATWNSSTLGIAGEVKFYPVFIQNHALEKLYGRSSRLGVAILEEAAVHAYLCRSLQKPVFASQAKMAPDHWLVEYRFNGQKLGYLVATLCEAKIVIKTFLFLTMNGTPEGDALYRRLKLSRRDKEYFGLDSLQAFVDSDLGKDPELQRIFRECGCQQLFECGDRDLLDGPRFAFAADLKSFLGPARLVRKAAISQNNRQPDWIVPQGKGGTGSS